MQAMMNGAECGTASPLAKLLQQQGQDNSLHNSSFAGPASQGSSLRTRQGMQGQEEAERFFGQGSGPGPAFEMERLRRELESVSREGAIKGDREWASQYHGVPGANPMEMAAMEESFRQANASELSAEYWRQQSSSAGPAFAQPAFEQQQAGFAPSYGAYQGGMRMGGMGGMGMGGRMGMMGMGGGSMYDPAMQEQQLEGKGKGRFVELEDADWEAQFAKAGAEVTDQATKSPALSANATLDQIAADTINLAQGDINNSDSDAALMESLESTWKNLKSTLNNSSITDSEMAAWESQYGSQFADLNGDSGLGDDLNFNADVHSPRHWTKENVDSFLANETAYPFVEENAFLGHPDPFAEGQRLLSEGAPLSQAAMAFEAACQQEPGRAEAWRAAGETWSADEREQKGMRCLEKAVACGGADGVGAWMSLAVAYVNEGQEIRALATLERWLSLAYPSITLPPMADTPSSPWDGHNRIIDMFLIAARSGPASRVQGQSTELADVDPDVQVGLGVLFYSNSDYDRAKDCFEAALSVRPNDFLLWNRLGATLANGGLPEEAIDAYRKALDLRPTFTRATYNLGVSCLNIGCYKEAAEHLLAAIEGQVVRENTGDRPVPEGEEDGSGNLWQTLRRAFLCMERHDLAERAHSGTDVNSFRGEFEF